MNHVGLKCAVLHGGSPKKKLIIKKYRGFSFCRYIQFNEQTVLFLTIQFTMRQQSYMIPSIAMYHKHFNQTSVIFSHRFTQS